MNAPRLEAVYFGPGPEGMWQRLANVLAHTAARHCPHWRVSIRDVEPVQRVSALGVPSHARNMQKMDEWHRLVMAAPEGDRILLIDADTMITGRLDAVWDLAFEFAYTTKQSRFPFNSGVVFLRVSARVKKFVDTWWRENLKMLEDGRYHQGWRAKYGGINQAALGAMLNGGGLTGMHVVELPCRVWNCEDSSWAAFDPASTRIVHCKSALRRAVLGRNRPEPAWASLVSLWRTFDAEATPQARTA